MHSDREPIYRRAEGQWANIMQAMIPGVDWTRSAKVHQNCPMPSRHGSSGGVKKFRLLERFADSGACICTCGAYTTGFKLIAAAKGISEHDAAVEVARYLRNDLCVPAQKAVSQPSREKKPYELNLTAIRANEHTWNYAADNLERPLVTRYLNTRGFWNLPGIDVLREHPNLQYFDAETEERSFHPAQVALVQSRNGTPLTLHRTYLANDGSSKADVSSQNAKKLAKSVLDDDDSLSRYSAAIRLFPFSGGRLHVAEGIETSLVPHHATGESAWSLVNTALMKAFVPPEGCTELVIWIDVDPKGAGQIAAAQLGIRVEQQMKIPVRLMSPVRDVPVPVEKFGNDEQAFKQVFAFLAKQEALVPFEVSNTVTGKVPDWADLWLKKHGPVT